jgi:RNA polymerase sigma-70 factor (ECF subfamily)
MIDTDETLLERVKRLDAHESWQAFYNAYWSAILRYARKLGLSDDQAQEVLQETMVTLMRVLPNFSYDRRKGKFRNFLLTIVHRRSLAALRRAKGLPDVSLDSDDPWGRQALKELLPAEAVDSAEREAEQLWREAVMEDCLARLEANPALDDGTFAAFRAYVIERRPAAEVAAEFGLKENALYQIKNRLLRRLRKDVAQRLREAGGSSDGA